MELIDFKNVVENSVAGFYISHVDGHFIYTNKKFANILGYKNFDDIKSTHIPSDIYYSKDDREKFLNALKEKGYLEGFIVRLKKKDGSSIYVTLSGELHGDGSLSGWIIDVTELVEKTKELELKNRIIEENPDAIFICDYDGNIVYSNKAFEKLIGESGESVGKTLNLFPLDSNVKKTIKKIVKTIKKRKIYTGEINIITKDDKIIPCGVKIFALYSKTGKIEYFINIFRDISQKIELEAKLAQAQKLEIMGKMTSSLIHDINNIISSLMSYIELLKIFKDEEDKFNKYYNKIEKLIDNSSMLVQRVLRFTKQSKISKTLIRIEEIIGDLDNFTEFLTHNKPHIDIEIKYRDKELLILGNKSSIIQILLNLVVNSIDAIEEAKRDKGKITIFFDRIFIKDEKYLRIIVEDNGKGIDKKIIKDIFTPFFTTKKFKDKSGTGLGLAIVAQEVERMNGKIDVCSEVGKGTKFILIFPEHDGRDIFKYIDNKIEDVAKNKEILIIDDDKFFTESISELLEYYGFNVKVANSGKEGFEILKKREFDLILLDFILPEKTPREILEYLKKHKPDIPVYIISGLIEPNVLELQVFKNVKMIIAKPITGEELVKRILLNV